MNSYRPHPAPPCGEREILWQAIIDQAREIGARDQVASEEEIDALLDEAFTAARRRASFAEERG